MEMSIIKESIVRNFFQKLKKSKKNTVLLVWIMIKVLKDTQKRKNRGSWKVMSVFCLMEIRYKSLKSALECRNWFLLLINGIKISIVRFKRSFFSLLWPVILIYERICTREFCCPVEILFLRVLMRDFLKKFLHSLLLLW